MRGASNEVTEMLRTALERALQAAASGSCLIEALEGEDKTRPALVLGAGKAAAAMAAAFRRAWPSPVRGLVVTRYGHGLVDGEDAGDIEILEAGHPSPDSASLEAGARLLELAAGIRPEETLYFLISGGGSALASVPLDSANQGHKRDAADFLMHNGADIREINCVRKHLSALKGGRLAKLAHPSPVRTFAISDVPGDDIADIASGPTIPDPTTQAEARRILQKYAYPDIQRLERYLTDPAYETPKPDDPNFAGDRATIIASAKTALAAARAFLAEAGFEVVYLGCDLSGDAQSLGREHARLAMQYRNRGQRVAILSGGETTVVIDRHGGRGGRNLVYLSALALELDGQPGIFALAADTDGIDGHGGHAGGIVTPDLLERGARAQKTLDKLLAEHDTYRFFDACGALIETGPTRTNVNDFRIIICQT